MHGWPCKEATLLKGVVEEQQYSKKAPQTTSRAYI